MPLEVQQPPQLGFTTEEIRTAVARLQEKQAADNRRLALLEQKVSKRERWDEMHDSASTLTNDPARTRAHTIGSGVEDGFGANMQNSVQERLVPQIQAFEHRSRMAVTAMEATQRRQVAKVLRVEQSMEDMLKRLTGVEDLSRRFTVVEERLGARIESPPSLLQSTAGRWEKRLGALEAQQKRTDNKLQTLEIQVDTGLKTTVGNGKDVGFDCEEVPWATERGLATLEKRASGQIQDLTSALATLRVKVDGQLQRVGSLAERLETAHEPALEAMHKEFNLARTQDQHRLDGELAVIRTHLQSIAESNDDAITEIQEGLKKAFADILALHPLNERVEAIEAEVGTASFQSSPYQPELLEMERETSFACGVVPQPMLERVQIVPRIIEPPSPGTESTSDQWNGGESPGTEPSLTPRGHETNESNWQQELETVAGHLRAADNLATRVAEFEQHLTSGRPEKHPRRLNFKGQGTAVAPTSPAQLSNLSREVSELQAQLLTVQLNVQTNNQEHNEHNGAGPPHKLGALAARICEVEQEFAREEVLHQCPLLCQDPKNARASDGMMSQGGNSDQSSSSSLC